MLHSCYITLRKVGICNFAIRIEAFTKNILQTYHRVLTELIDAVRCRKRRFSSEAGLTAELQSKHI